MRCNIRSVNYTLRSVRTLNDPYASNGSLSFLPPHYHWPRSAHCTLRSVKELNHPYESNGSLSFLPPSLTSNEVFFLSLPNKMQYTIRELHSTERKALNDLYASNGSLSFLPPHYHWPRSAHCTLRSVKELKNEVFLLSLPNKMPYTIRELYSTERKST